MGNFFYNSAITQIDNTILDLRTANIKGVLISNDYIFSAIHDDFSVHIANHITSTPNSIYNRTLINSELTGNIPDFTDISNDNTITKSLIIFNDDVISQKKTPIAYFDIGAGLPFNNKAGSLLISFSDYIFRLPVGQTPGNFPNHLFVYTKGHIAQKNNNPITRISPSFSLGKLDSGLQKKPDEFSRYSDISTQFLPHPLTGDVINKYDESAIAQSVRNIILTSPGEISDDYSHGTGISKFLFEQYTPILEKEIQELITISLANKEQRIIVSDVVVRNESDNSRINISIQYNIINSGSVIYSTELSLKRT